MRLHKLDQVGARSFFGLAWILRWRYLAPALALTILLYTPVAKSGGPIIPSEATFGGEIIDIQVMLGGSYENLGQLGIEVGVSVQAELAGFEETPGLGLKGPLDRLLDAVVPAAYASGSPSSNTFTYESLEVRIASAAPFKFSDFTGGKTLTIADDQVEPPAFIGELCGVGADGSGVECDYLWAQGAEAAAVEPSGFFALDSSVVNGIPRGLNVVLTASPDTLDEPIYEPDGEGDLGLDFAEDSLLYLDLIDLGIGADATVRLVVELDTVSIVLPPPGGVVPSLGNAGGILLVMVVCLFGALLLVFPRRRQASGGA